MNRIERNPIFWVWSVRPPEFGNNPSEEKTLIAIFLDFSSFYGTHGVSQTVDVGQNNKKY